MSIYSAGALCAVNCVCVQLSDQCTNFREVLLFIHKYYNLNVSIYEYTVA